VSALPSGLPPDAGDDETVSRALTSSRWFAPTIGRIKYQAFIPAPDNDTSVVRSTDFTEDKLWQVILSLNLTHDGTPKTIYGAATVPVRVIRNAGLEVVPQEPPHYHANIRKWAVDDDEQIRKALRMSIAQQIADEATLSLKTDPNRSDL
jgi:hypothetical protein